MHFGLIQTIGGKVHILIVFLLHNCTHCRKDIGFEEKPICRNTVQGRYLLSDDNGDHFPFLSFYLACYYPKFVIFSGSVIRRLFLVHAPTLVTEDIPIAFCLFCLGCDWKLRSVAKLIKLLDEGIYLIADWTIPSFSSFSIFSRYLGQGSAR